MAEQSPQWYCHNCHFDFSIPFIHDGNETCQRCHSEFIERVEDEENDPRNTNPDEFNFTEDEPGNLGFGIEVVNGQTRVFSRLGEGTGTDDENRTVGEGAGQWVNAIQQLLQMAMGRNNTNTNDANNNNNEDNTDNTDNSNTEDNNSNNNSNAQADAPRQPQVQSVFITSDGTTPVFSQTPPPALNAMFNYANFGANPNNSNNNHNTNTNTNTPAANVHIHTDPNTSSDTNTPNASNNSNNTNNSNSGSNSNNGNNGNYTGTNNDVANLLMQALSQVFGGTPQNFGIGHGQNFGDFVFSQQGLDNIITQLMDQNAGSSIVPATEDAITKLPVKKVDQEIVQQGKDCGVCKDDFELEQLVVDLPCKHEFHQDCIYPWLRINGTCPICRTPAGPQAPRPQEGGQGQSTNAESNNSQSQPAQSQSNILNEEPLD